MKTIISILIMISASFVMAASTDNSLVGVKVIPLPEGKVRVDFQFAKPVKQLPASFLTDKPARLILDFIRSDIQLPVVQKMNDIKVGSLKGYNIVSVKNRVRAILDLEGSISYSGTVAGLVYSLVLNGKSSDIFTPTKSVFITNRAIHAKHQINCVDFRGIDKQGGRVLIDVSDSTIPIDVTQIGKEVVVKFLNTKISRKLQKRFDVADFHSPAQVVTMQQEGKNVRMTITNKGDYAHFVYQVNKQIMVDIVPLTAEELQSAKLKKEVFTGKRISLNFQNISIKAVLQILADFTGINIVVSDKVEGTISLRLNDIPWDQALNVILTTQGLDKVRSDNVILINTKDELNKLEAEKLKSQQVIAKLEPIRSDLIQINNAKASELALLIKDKKNSLLSERGNVSVDERTNTIWIQETGTKIEEIRELIKQLDVAVKQVLIEARIVEVSKDFAQDIGIRWGVSRPPALSGSLYGANQVQQGINLDGLTPIQALSNVTPLPIPGHIDPSRLNLDLPAAVNNAATIGLALARIGENIFLDLELSALESEGQAELIASPRLITTNQQSALIESGQEIPYQEATSSGATAVAFKKAVLSLKVTPQITPDNKVLMDLQINQDTPSPQLYQGVPAINTKEIQTKVLVNNGQTIVLGGIYNQDKTKGINRIPFFGQLPVVGVLFRNTKIDIRNRELLIFITPKIITNNLSIATIEGREKEVYK